MFLTVMVVNYVVIMHLTDLFASVGNHSSLNIDFLQNERLDISAADGNCLISNIEVTAVCSAIKPEHIVFATLHFSYNEYIYVVRVTAENLQY